MSLDMAAIRAALNANLSTISGLTVYSVVPDTLTPPCALVGYEPGDLVMYDASFGLGTQQLRLCVQVYVSEASGVAAAQPVLDPYIDSSGAKSIVQALYTDRKLGGACSDLSVVKARNNGLYTWPEPDERGYLGVEFVLDIIV